jgi:hypothetical protein
VQPGATGCNRAGEARSRGRGHEWPPFGLGFALARSLQWLLDEANDNPGLLKEVPMTHKHSFLALAFGLVSTALFGCASDANDISVDDPSKAPEATQASGDAKEKGYGYEMLPLRLAGASEAPAGNTLMADGRVAPEEVLRQAEARVPALRACYEAALKRDPAAKGQVVVDLRFDAEGSLRSSKVQSSTIGDAALGQCVTNSLGTISLPASSRGILEVIYPVEFAPEDLSRAAPQGT